jgi:hypothetical protein
MKVLFHTSAWEYPVFPELFMEESILFSGSVCKIFVKNQLTLNVEFFFWILYSLPLEHVSLLCQFNVVLITLTL